MTGGQHGDQAADGQDRRQRRAPRHGLSAPVAEAHARERERTGREQCDADARPDRRLRARSVHIRRVEILRERADVAIARGRACPRAQRLVLHEHGDALLQPLGVVLIRGERREVLRQLLPVRRQRLPAGGQRTGRRVELALPGRDLGRRSVERLLPGGELFSAGVILRLPALEPALADVIRHDARSKRELERVIRLLLRAEGRRQLAERAGAAAQLRIGDDTVGPLLLRAHDAPRRHGHDEHRRREQHPAGRAARRGQRQAALRGQCRPAHEGIAQQQKLRQHEQHEKHRDERPDAHEPAHAGHRAGRDARADEQAGGDEHRAGCDDGREGEVQRRDHGLARALIGARLGIVRGDDDRIVHVAAHLNGAGHEIDHEEHILAREHRDAEVDPDAALNDEREQNGHTERAEREQQHEHDHEDGHGADHDVVLRERLLGPVGGHGVADEIAVGGVVLVHDGVDAVEQGKRLVPVRGRGKREHETMVRRALELRAGALELAAERRDLRRLRGAERDGAVGDLVIQEFEQLQQRHLIAAQILRGRLRGAVFGRVEREERRRARAVRAAELRERPVIDRVRQPVAAGRLGSAGGRRAARTPGYNPRPGRRRPAPSRRRNHP